MSVKFVIDSASDILPQEAAALGITVLPLTVIFNGSTYRDAVDLSHREFFEKLASSKELPTTSQLPPADFADCFEALVAEGHDVVVITVSSKLSGTCQSATIAAADFPGRVFVVDSLSAAIGQRILLLRGLQLAEQDLSAREIAEILDQEKTRIRVMAVIDTLEYLKKGGRISAATALAGTVLSMKPAIEISDGLVAMAGKARGSRQANALLRQLMDKYGGANPDAPYALVYSGLNDDHLQKFIAEQSDLWQAGDDLPIHSLGCVIGTHVGPGAYGIAFFEK